MRLNGGLTLTDCSAGDIQWFWSCQSLNGFTAFNMPSGTEQEYSYVTDVKKETTNSCLSLAPENHFLIPQLR